MNADPLWTLDELGAQVALALADDYAGAASGRVRDVPDTRTIRYYTTLGLIDRPAQMRGRTALYGRRHLYQLVAIKRLQAQGLSLLDIQQQLLGRTDRDLARLAKLANDKDGSPVPIKPEGRAFWRAEPAAVKAPAPREPPLPLQAVPLGGEVTLLFAPARTLQPHDHDAIRAAAAPLLKYLEKRQLLGPTPERGIP